jgi:hypothetical protein
MKKYREIKKPLTVSNEGSLYISAAAYSPTNAVPSALTGLTALFGMGSHF